MELEQHVAGRTTGKSRTGATKINLLVDILIFAAFLVAGAPHFTGMAIHEWLGITFGAAIVTHLLLHWQWLVEVTKRFFRRMPWSTRINYVLNFLLFVTVTLIIFSGILMSEEALPLLGITFASGRAWHGVHALTAELAPWLVGLHVALHWKWIVNAVRRYLIQPLLGRARTPVSQPVALAEVER
jgi:hypothetical protein